MNIVCMFIQYGWVWQNSHKHTLLLLIPDHSVNSISKNEALYRERTDSVWKVAELKTRCINMIHKYNLIKFNDCHQNRSCLKKKSSFLNYLPMGLCFLLCMMWLCFRLHSQQYLKKVMIFLFKLGWVNSRKELVLSKSLEQNFTCYLYKLCQSRLGFHHCVSVLLKWHTTKVMVVFQCNVFHPSLHSESSESNISETILDDPSLWSTQYSLGTIKICIHFIKCRHFGILITECVYFTRD